jgi:hypothetical protein
VHSPNLGIGFIRECIRFGENFAQCQATLQSSSDYAQVKLYTGGAGLVAVRTRLEGTPDSLYCVGRSIIRWQLVPVPDGLGEERITKGLTARSFLIKAIFASSPAVVRLNILVAVYIN